MLVTPDLLRHIYESIDKAVKDYKPYPYFCNGVYSIILYKENRFSDIIFKRFLKEFELNYTILYETQYHIVFPVDDIGHQDVLDIMGFIKTYDWFTLTAEEKYLENEAKICAIL